MKNGRLPLTFNGLLPAVEFKNFPAAPETSGTQQPIFLWSTPSWGSTMEAGSIARVSGSFSFRSLKSILKESTHYYRRLLYECIIIKLSKHKFSNISTRNCWHTLHFKFFSHFIFTCPGSICHQNRIN